MLMLFFDINFVIIKINSIFFFNKGTPNELFLQVEEIDYLNIKLLISFWHSLRLREQMTTARITFTSYIKTTLMCTNFLVLQCLNRIVKVKQTSCEKSI